ncbi:hypothetical protein GW931_02220 [archaeon]|nr:hypothetical protein [archaeon]PJC45554.1 MAG: hypothetical protein CO037_00875 [Candidatus Pacearchaeota archaeon CG_4_9_14_0_2_um_filter_30_8]
MNQNVLIFDSSSLISITMSGLLNEFKKLKKTFPGKFIIPEEVKVEIINHPLEIKKFELEALKLNQLLKEGILEMPESLGIDSTQISNETKKLIEIANSTFFENKEKEIHLIDSGETACLVLSKILTKKGIKNLIVIDERTTRLLSEKPENLKNLLTKKIHTNINIKKENLKSFSGIKMVRSAELMFIAYKKGLMDLKDKKTLDAVLYALKFKGCGISGKEIEILKRMS